jgi:thymidylate synthase (FAD)
MSAKLTYITPLWVIAKAIRYSHDNHHLSDSSNGEIGQKDFKLIKRVGFKLKHQSVLEHSLLVFDIECSRALLQELARHRLQSLTVKSTRYTLNELRNESPFITLRNTSKRERSEYSSRAKKYLVFTLNEDVNNMSILALENLRQSVKQNISNDIAKYCLPECFKTSLQLSLNLRSLLNLLKLRLSKDALWEFRELAEEMFEVLPGDYKELILEDEDIKKELEGMK